MRQKFVVKGIENIYDRLNELVSYRNHETTIEASSLEEAVKTAEETRAKDRREEERGEGRMPDISFYVTEVADTNGNVLYARK